MKKYKVTGYYEESIILEVEENEGEEEALEKGKQELRRYNDTYFDGYEIEELSDEE